MKDRKTDMFKLIIQETGCDGQEFLLENKSYTIGRGESNDIIISDEGVSRQHAVIKFEDEHFYIEDRNSSCGVFVNDQKITQKTLLAAGETITIGETKISIDGFVTSCGQGEGKTTVIPKDEYQRMLQALQQKEETEGKIPEPVLHGDGLEYGGDKTVLYDLKSASGTSTPSYNKLVIVSNEDYGKEYVLNQPESFIGRTSDCLIQIDDKKVSAHHARVDIRDVDCFIKDLNSTNGTKVNGRPIKDEQQIRTGDEVEIGSTTFRFIYKDSIFEKAESLASSKKEKFDSPKVMKLLIIAVTGILIIFFMVVLFPKLKPASRAAPAVAETQKDEIKTTDALKEKFLEKKAQENINAGKEKAARLSYSIANQFMAIRCWPSAIEKYNEVLEINPDFLEAKEALEKAKFEQQAYQVMEKAGEFFTSNQYEQAIEAFRLIPLESVYYQTAKIKIAAIEQKNNELVTHEQIGNIESEPEKVKSASGIKEDASHLISGALDNYAKGNVGAAMENLDAVLQMEPTQIESVKSEVITLQDRMLKVCKGYDNGLSAYKNNQVGQAFQIWSEVMDLDKKVIGKRDSFFSSQIATYIADEYSLQAQRAFQSNEYEIALSKSEQALKAKPEHQQALEIQGRLTERAKELYEKAYILEDLNTEQALSIWKEALKICPTSSEYYAKTKNRIQKYE